MVKQVIKYELKDAVGLFSQQTSTINSLWTVYVGATFAAAGFGGAYLSNILDIISVIITSMALTVGFWAFTLGHLRLLTQALSINRKLKSEISSILELGADESDISFKASIAHLISTANPPWISICIHLLIDLCVTLILWARVLSIWK